VQAPHATEGPPSAAPSAPTDERNRPFGQAARCSGSLGGGRAKDIRDTQHNADLPVSRLSTNDRLRIGGVSGKLGGARYSSNLYHKL